jgi:preprotein translocase subunit SecG
MENFLAALHILVAVVLIALVLVQDSSGGALGIGGGGSNSVLGATGAQTLAAKLTTAAAVLFAVTCIGLTFLSSRTQRSVLDTGGALAIPPVSAPAATTPPSTDGSAAATTTAPAPATSPEAIPQTQE